MIRSLPLAVLTRRGSKFPVTGRLIEIQMNTKVTDIKSKRRKPRRPSEPDLERMAQGVRLILEGMGEDPEREGLRETPRRFFFQAEDGIRDLTVTGVQTCALPI